MFKIGDIVCIKDVDITRNNDKVKSYIGKAAEITGLYRPFDNTDEPYYILSLDNKFVYSGYILEMVKPAAELSLSDKDIDEVMYEI